MVSLFISYARPDFSQIRPILSRLKAEGIAYWLDQEILRPGEDWEVEIRKGIAAQDCFVMFVSPRQLQSTPCRGEFLHAHNQLRKPIIPLLLAPCEAQLWIEIPTINYIAYYKNPETGYKNLLSGLLKDGATRASRQCPLCQHASRDDGTLHCPQCNAVFQPLRLSQLYRCTARELRQYVDHFLPLINSDFAPYEPLLSLGLVYLGLEEYNSAATYIKRAQQISSTDAYLWYLRALIALHGTRPATLHTDYVQAARKHLLEALRLDPLQRHAALLLAWVNEDGLQRHGFAVGKPSIADCLQLAREGESTPQELLMMARLIPFVDSATLQILRQILNN